MVRGRSVVVAWVVLVLSGLAGALAPAIAGAQGGEPALPLGFTLKASHGYTASVFGFDGGGEHPDEVGIIVQRPRAAALYVRRGAMVSEGSIKASFGGVADIDVRFHPSGGTRAEHSACTENPVKFRAGSYVGTIELHGEEGFFEASATRARGDMRFLVDLLCASGHGDTFGPNLRGAELDVHSREGKSEKVELQVNKNRPGARMRFDATVTERHGGLFVARGTEGVAPAAAFSYDPMLHEATLRPPAPFSGSATLRRPGGGPGTWRGSLAVDLPGNAGVPLTGHGVRVSIRHAEQTKGHPHPDD